MRVKRTFKIHIRLPEGTASYNNQRLTQLISQCPFSLRETEQENRENHIPLFQSGTKTPRENKVHLDCQCPNQQSFEASDRCTTFINLLCLCRYLPLAPSELRLVDLALVCRPPRTMMTSDCCPVSRKHFEGEDYSFSTSWFSTECFADTNKLLLSKWMNEWVSISIPESDYHH